MTTKEAKHAVRLQEWGRMVTQCQESGLTVNQWCRENNLKPACYYYRLAQVRKAILNRNSLVPASERSSTMPTLVKVDTASMEQEQSSVPKTANERYFRLQCRGAVLEIPVGAGAEDIAEVLKAMGQYVV